MRKPIIAIVQARMDALRLPNKMMLWLKGMPVIEWVYRRVSISQMVDRVVFALPDTKSNDVLEGFLLSLGANVFRGSENDVLGRFYRTACSYRAETVLRVCADNPFICASEIDRLIFFFEENDCDYAYNHIPRNNRYPDGLGAEIVHFSLLQSLEREAVKVSHREHIFNYIWDNQDGFRIATCDPLDEAIAYPHLKLDLDTPDDYAWMLRLPVRPDMSARQIVDAALSCPRSTKSEKTG